MSPYRPICNVTLPILFIHSSLLSTDSVSEGLIWTHPGSIQKTIFECQCRVITWLFSRSAVHVRSSCFKNLAFPVGCPKLAKGKILIEPFEVKLSHDQNALVRVSPETLLMLFIKLNRSTLLHQNFGDLYWHSVSSIQHENGFSIACIWLLVTINRKSEPRCRVLPS